VLESAAHPLESLVYAQLWLSLGANQVTLGGGGHSTIVVENGASIQGAKHLHQDSECKSKFYAANASPLQDLA
jgi:hypothetical protein